MDRDLAMPLYFASRGIGKLHGSASSEVHPEPYKSTARVLLSGLGSDELLGGYSRHRVAFRNGSWTSLVDEVLSQAFAMYIY